MDKGSIGIVDINARGREEATKGVKRGRESEGGRESYRGRWERERERES